MKDWKDAPETFLDGWFADQAARGRETEISPRTRGLPELQPGSSMEIETSFMQVD